MTKKNQKSSNSDQMPPGEGEAHDDFFVPQFRSTKNAVEKYEAERETSPKSDADGQNKSGKDKSPHGPGKTIQERSDPRQLLAEFAKTSDLKSVQNACDLLGLSFQPKKLWANRGSEETPAQDWIRKYYGQWYGDTWDANGLKKSMLRAIDRDLYQAYGAYLSRLRKKNLPIPDDLNQLEDDASSRVEKELEDNNIVEPKDAFKRFPNDPDTAQRLFKAAQRRSLT